MRQAAEIFQNNYGDNTTSRETSLKENCSITNVFAAVEGTRQRHYLQFHFQSGYNEYLICFQSFSPILTMQTDYLMTNIR